jgi:hypothetical protein
MNHISLTQGENVLSLAYVVCHKKNKNKNKIYIYIYIRPRERNNIFSEYYEFWLISH